MKAHKSNSTIWFLRCLYTYISIFLIVLLVMAGMFSRFESSVEKMLCEGYQRQMETAATTLVKSLEQTASITALLAEDNAVKRISRATQESLPQIVMEMHSAQSTMVRTYSQIGDEYLATFLLYPGNRYLVSNTFVTNDYLNEYPSRFSFGDMTAAEWRSYVTRRTSLQSWLGRADTLASLDFGSVSRRALPYIVSLTNAAHTGRIGVMIYWLDAQWLYNLLQLEEGMRFSLYGASNELLLGEETPPSEREYLILRAANSVAPQFCIELAVPHVLINRKLSDVTRIIKVYIFSGLLGVLLLSVGYALLHFRNIRSIVSQSDALSASGYSSPYRYAHDMLKTLSEARDSMQQRIILMESTYANNLLVNVCQHGIASSDDFAECEHLLGSHEGGYYVALLKTDQVQSASRTFIAAEESFEQATQALVVHSSPNMSLYIIRNQRSWTQEDLCQCAGRLLCAFGVWGVSSLQQDVRALHIAYRQAYSALAGCSGERRYACFAEALPENPEKALSISALDGLRNLIYAGKADRVEAFFLQLEEDSGAMIGVEQFQTFFVLRQTLMRISAEIASDHVPQSGLDFLYDERSHDGIERLKDYALRLTAQAQSLQREDTGGIRHAIIRMIESDFYNPNLSADYLAQQLGCSPKFIYQTVKEHTGKTPGELIEENRLRFAADLLLNTNKKNEDIARLCGFGALNTFYRIFRKKYGVAPGEWKKQQMTRQEP